MKKLEIIHLRSSRELSETLSNQIIMMIRAAENNNDSIELFHRMGLESDVAIHINHSETSETTESSSLGLRLAASLKEYGMVEHTMWEKLQ